MRHPKVIAFEHEGPVASDTRKPVCSEVETKVNRAKLTLKIEFQFEGSTESPWHFITRERHFSYIESSQAIKNVARGDAN